MDNDNIQKFERAFHIVKQMGYVKSNRSGSTGIGKTLEDYMGVIENNNDRPDLFGFEMKGHRALAESKITLFTKAPTMPKKANNFLKDNYGTADKDFPEMKILHVSMYHNKYTEHSGGYSFKLKCQDSEERLYLMVKDTLNDVIVSNNIYWSYTILRGVVDTKIKYLAFINADNEKRNGIEYFHYKNCTLYSGITFEKLLDFIKSDSIMFDIRVGSYKTGKMRGKLHDHGSGFRIKKEKLLSLYGSKYEII